jgi:hypothetical protein
MPLIAPKVADTYRPVSVVADATDGICGYRFAGLRAGPALTVVAPVNVRRRVSGRLAMIPSLHRLRGEIRIVSSMAAQMPPTDAWLILGESHAADAYWRVLARAAALGIIEGRGIPARFGEQATVSPARAPQARAA